MRTPFYDSVFLNGTYTADILGCNWTCLHCWSAYGWQGKSVDERPRKGGGGEFTSAQIADKLIAGMKRNAMPMCRISGGEASMYWDPHIVGVIREVITRTQGLRMVVDGATGPDGEAMGIVIETNGGTLQLAQLKALEEEFGEDAARIVLAVGVKATSASRLQELTGMSEKTCERFHRRQMDNIKWLALRSRYLGWFANYLDAFVDDEEFASFQRGLERKRPGVARLLSVDPFKRSAFNTKADYTPKRFRTEGEHFNEPGAEQDEEIVVIEGDRQDTPAPETDPTTAPPEHVLAMRDMEAATADLPEGSMG